jgi:hypothetical protein
MLFGMGMFVSMPLVIYFVVEPIVWMIPCAAFATLLFVGVVVGSFQTYYFRQYTVILDDKRYHIYRNTNGTYSYYDGENLIKYNHKKVQKLDSTLNDQYELEKCYEYREAGVKDIYFFNFDIGLFDLKVNETTKRQEGDFNIVFKRLHEKIGLLKVSYYRRNIGAGNNRTIVYKYIVSLHDVIENIYDFKLKDRPVYTVIQEISKRIQS